MRFKKIWLFLPVLAATAAYGMFTAGSLTVNGKTVKTDYVMKDGKTYVPLADVAKVFNMVPVKKGDGYELTAAGGAGQVQGLSGKIGDLLSCGTFTLKVVKVYRGPKYVKEFGSGEVTPNTDAQDVVAIRLRMKNATKEAIVISPFGGDVTALTDEDEHSYPAFTGMASDVTEAGPKLLPGSAYDFALTYMVPKSAVLKDLVYQIQCYGFKEKATFRISLKEEK